MDAIEQLKEEVRSGRIDPIRLVDLNASLQQQLQATQQQLQAALLSIAELEKQPGNASGSAKLDQPFSLRAEEKRQQAQDKKRRKLKDRGRRGRVRSADELALAQRVEDVYPNGVSPSLCWLSHTRPV